MGSCVGGGSRSSVCAPRLPRVRWGPDENAVATNGP